jgi:hypothetical protein
MKAYSEKGSNHMKRIAKTKEILSLKNRESISQKLGVYAKKLGMGIEPTYSSSAGCRLNRSATPARVTLGKD